MARDPVASPQRRAAKAAEVQQGLCRRIVGRDPLAQQLDARAAKQGYVGPGTALAVDQAPRLAVFQSAPGLDGHIRLDATA